MFVLLFNSKELDTPNSNKYQDRLGLRQKITDILKTINKIK